jgi:outer membrane protein OmpA-like peptidoglycan-associated protein
MDGSGRLVRYALVVLLAGAAPASAHEGAYVGVDLGVASPTNDNFAAHVTTGMTAQPFGGFMFNDYLGLQGRAVFNGWPPKDEGRSAFQSNINNEDQWTTMVGMTAGPRLNAPLFNHWVDVHLMAEGGGFKGLGGRLNQWAPGFTVGAGIDLNVTDNWSLGAFGRWNRAYMSPHPYVLLAPPQLSPDQQGPADAQWFTVGLSVKYSFAEAPKTVPPPPPAAAPAPAPVKKKLVLRAVHFDFNKATLRRDAIPVLDEAVNLLKQEPQGVGVICIGHTDSIGSDAYNLKLSTRRAEAVKDYLVSKGISARRIRVEGRGEAEPVASNATAEGRAQNRRVELRLTD